MRCFAEPIRYFYSVNFIRNSITYEVTLGRSLILRYTGKENSQFLFHQGILFKGEPVDFPSDNVKSKCTKDGTKLKRPVRESA